MPVREWLPDFAHWVDAPEPPRVSEAEALRRFGPEAVTYHTQLTGASNARAKAQLGFKPRPLAWRRRPTFVATARVSEILASWP